MNYKTLRVRWEEELCYIQLYRPEEKNAINQVLIKECFQVVHECETKAKIVILQGLDDVFCFGADLKAVAESELTTRLPSPEPIYDLWLQFARGSFVSIAHVRGQANAGGVGFVSACDLVLADNEAMFSFSELLFGLMPACVFPFLVRKIGFQKSKALILTTKPVGVKEAFAWGLVDAYEKDSVALLQKYLLRLNCLNKTAIARFKEYTNQIDTILEDQKERALSAYSLVFNDTENRKNIVRYIRTGLFPWD